MTARPTRVRTRGGGILLVGWVALVGMLAAAAWLGGRESAPVPVTPPPNVQPPPAIRSPSPSPSTAAPVTVVLPRPGDIVAGSAIQLVVDITRHVGRVEAAVDVAGVAIGRTWFETTVAGRLEVEVGLLAPFDSAPAELLLTPLGGGSPTRVPIRLESADRVRVLYPADGQEIGAGSLASRGASAVATAVVVGTAAAGTGAGTPGGERIVAELRTAGGTAIAAAGSGSPARGGLASSFAIPLHAEVTPQAGNGIVTVTRGADRASSGFALASMTPPGESPPRADEALDDLTFVYPSSWQETRFAGPLPFRGTADGLLAYAANGLLNTCRLDRSLGDARAGEACEWPLGRLGPGQLLVAWFQAADRWLLPGAAGAPPPEWFDVDGHPAEATLQLGGLCAPIGLATLEVELAGPGHLPRTSPALDRPIVTHRFVACLGGGTRRQVGREIESALDVVASLRWAGATGDAER